MRKAISIILIVLFIACVAAATCFAYKYLKTEKSYDDQNSVIDDIRDHAKEPSISDRETESRESDNPSWQESESSSGEDSPDSTEGSDPGTDSGVTAADPMFESVNFGWLQSVNSDATRWITIPGTALDYVVMQERTVGEYYYLWRNIYGEDSTIGLPVSPAVPMGADDPHLLIFGHAFRATNDSMFGVIKNYFDRSYFDEHPYVYLYYPDRTEKWLAVQVSNVYDDDIVYDLPYTYGSDDYKAMQEHLFSNYRHQLTEHVSGIDSGDPLLILSCCDRNYEWDRGRAILVCRLAEVLDKDTGQVSVVYEGE